MKELMKFLKDCLGFKSQVEKNMEAFISTWNGTSFEGAGDNFDDKIYKQIIKDLKILKKSRIYLRYTFIALILYITFNIGYFTFLRGEITRSTFYIVLIAYGIFILGRHIRFTKLIAKFRE